MKLEQEGGGVSSGGREAGSRPEDWSGAGEKPGQGYAGGGSKTVPKAGKPPPPPTVPRYTAPDLYTNRIAPEQRDIRNPQSTSHQYLARFGASGQHF